MCLRNKENEGSQTIVKLTTIGVKCVITMCFQEKSEVKTAIFQDKNPLKVTKPTLRKKTQHETKGQCFKSYFRDVLTELMLN